MGMGCRIWIIVYNVNKEELGGVMKMSFWKDNEKIITVAGMALVGYYLLSNAVEALPQLPSWATKGYFGDIGLITVGAVLTIYGAYMLQFKY